MRASGIKAMVTLSFDDGREDTYRLAYKIMKEYGLFGTIHVTTGWIDGTWSTNDWLSAINGAMTIDQVKECYNNGFEITSHGDKHITDKNDLEVSLNKLKEWEVIDLDNLGFSSPNSKLTAENKKETEDIFESNNIKYTRSGRSSKCYRPHMKMIYVLQAHTKSKLLFRVFNQHNKIKAPIVDKYMLPSTVIKSNNSAKQIMELLKNCIKTNSWSILMFHSILAPEDYGYGKDSWYWDVKEFKKLCQWLSLINGKEILVVTLKDGFKNFRGFQD